MAEFKPMLAGKAEKNIRFPILASPKLDGVRAIVKNGKLLSRNLKPIPNIYTQQLFAGMEGYDGELIVGSPTAPDCFRTTTSGVMSVEGKPDVWFYVFDNCNNPELAFTNRFMSLYEFPRVKRVPHHLCTCQSSLDQVEEKYLADGYEGVMLRMQNGPYKYGRSTEREGYLLKLKRFEDSEAIILDVEELMHNGNEAKVNALGHLERSSHKENMIPDGRMGRIRVRDIHTNVEFGIGTGFDDQMRQDFWDNKQQYIGKVVKYKYFPTGSKDKPRFPTYLGLRAEGDM